MNGPSLDGNRELVEGGDAFTCRCGKKVDGAHRGPRGGRVWAWRRESGDRFCTYECAKLFAPDLDIELADDYARGDWEAEQGEAMYG